MGHNPDDLDPSVEEADALWNSLATPPELCGDESVSPETAAMIQQRVQEGMAKSGGWINRRLAKAGTSEGAKKAWDVRGRKNGGGGGGDTKAQSAPEAPKGPGGWERRTPVGDQPAPGANTEVAKTILQQMGGNQLRAMTGANGFVSDGNSLSFRLPKAKNGINSVNVRLAGDDTYSVSFRRIQGSKMHPVSSFDGIYNDQLRGLFERETGLATSLTQRFDKSDESLAKYGTSEGAVKAWDVRGRSKDEGGGSSSKTFTPDPNKDADGDGVTDSARVGVCADCVPPPPEIGRLPGLTDDERAVESQFADAFEKDPDAMVKEYLDRLNSTDPSKKIGDAPNIFNTDDAKLLSPGYNPQGVPKDQLLDARSQYNVAVHQTANAIAKRAFLTKLDELAKLPEGDPQRAILVTSGGVASGKGYALANAEGTSNIAKEVGAIWDAAGEQNATENPWILKECEKRGLNPIFAYVHADPVSTWENPERGVIERAGSKGRMVDARVFADSYAIGAKNFKSFADKHAGKANFIFIDNTKKPTVVAVMPKEALGLDAETLYTRASQIIDERREKLKPAVYKGGTIGRRIWGKAK